MPFDPFILAGARQIVGRCLGLEPGQDLVVFFDETTLDTATVLCEAAEALGVPITLLLVPAALQRRIPRESDLSLLAQGAARQARAILTCVNGQPECLAFRQRLLESQWSARTRIGHMPGVTPEVLKLANVDLERLSADCRAVELALARGRRLELTSFSPDGVPHRLTADIGGWERLPVASDGIIHDGVWGNVPSGETYIAPVEDTAEGSVCITGSIPGRVLRPSDALVLHFRRGRLVRMEPEQGPAAQWLEQTQIQKAKAAKDRNWSNLAEIGVGLNPAVQDLTGNMLYDEKAAGTAHVALGGNHFLGGRVQSAIHCDLVMHRPILAVDGHPILDRGRLRFVASEWREDWSRVPLHSSPMREARQVARSGVQATRTPDGRLQRVLRPQTGRVSACTVGDDETAQFAHLLYDALPDEGEWCPVEALVRHTSLDADTIRRVLHVMSAYELVRAR
jgi:leucyl aminopeptidase (aminopeptidase T)